MHLDVTNDLLFGHNIPLRQLEHMATKSFGTSQIDLYHKTRIGLSRKNKLNKLKEWNQRPRKSYAEIYLINKVRIQPLQVKHK